MKKKKLCEEIGHSWQKTASLNWRTCRRSDCQQAQNFIQGQWRDVKKPVKRPQESQESQRIMSLFESLKGM